MRFWGDSVLPITALLVRSTNLLRQWSPPCTEQTVHRCEHWSQTPKQYRKQRLAVLPENCSISRKELLRTPKQNSQQAWLRTGDLLSLASYLPSLCGWAKKS